jgi:pimeloyl-ACP methyl ester carboxylesterase
MGYKSAFVLIHGSWLGGWCWRETAAILLARQHYVLAPSLPGMGERAAHFTRNITIDTFIDDVVSQIRSQNLTDVVLVGHSFGGVVITGVADRIPQRIRHLIYLDAIVVENGGTAFSVYPSEEVDLRLRAAGSGTTVPAPKSLPKEWGVRVAMEEYVLQHLTPHPIGSYITPLCLRYLPGAGRSCTYIRCTKPPHPLLNEVQERVKSRNNWNMIELETGHLPMLTHASLLAECLETCADT